MRSKGQPQAAPANEDYEPEGDWLDVARYRSQMAGAQANQQYGPGADNIPAWMRPHRELEASNSKLRVPSERARGDLSELNETQMRAMGVRKRGEDLPPKE